MLADTADARLMTRIARTYAQIQQHASPTARQRACADHINACLYVPATYLHSGIKGANGALRHYGAAADLRDATILETL